MTEKLFRFMDWEGKYEDIKLPEDLRYKVEQIPCSQECNVVDIITGKNVIIEVSEYDACTVADLLNELTIKIYQLEDDVFDWKGSAEDYHRISRYLKKENEELKQEIETLQEQIVHFMEVDDV